MASLLEQASKWLSPSKKLAQDECGDQTESKRNAEHWEHEARLASTRLATVQQKLNQAESHEESANHLKTQLKEQQIKHVKDLQAVQYEAQQTVGDMKRQKLAQEGTWTQELDRMSALAKASQEDGAQHALEARTATTAVKDIQKQLDLRDHVYEKLTEGIKTDLKYLIMEAEKALNEMLDNAQSSKEEQQLQMEKFKQELVSVRAEAMGMVSSQKAGHVRLQLEVQKSYHKLNAEYEKALTQLQMFEKALMQRNDSLSSLKKLLSETSENLERTTAQLASVMASLKEVQSQLVSQTSLATDNCSKAKTAAENSFSLSNDIQRLTTQHNQLQHSFTALQGRAHELDGRVRAMDGVSAQNTTLLAQLAVESQAVADAHARIQDLENVVAVAHAQQQGAAGVVNCAVCMTGDSDYGFLHVGQMHAGYCQACAATIARLPEKRCPVCRVPIEAVIKIFT